MLVLCSNLKKYADHNNTKYAMKVYGIMPHLHIHKLIYGNGEGGKWQRFIPALLFPTSSPDYTDLGMSVLCRNFLLNLRTVTRWNMQQKYAELCPVHILHKTNIWKWRKGQFMRKKMRYTHFWEICHDRIICIKPTRLVTVYWYVWMMCWCRESVE